MRSAAIFCLSIVCLVLVGSPAGPAAAGPAAGGLTATAGAAGANPRPTPDSQNDPVAVHSGPTPGGRSGPAYPAAVNSQAVPQNTPGFSARLLSFPPWMGPTSNVTATVEVRNNGFTTLSGLSIGIEGYQGPQSRSDLANQLAGRDLRPALGEWGDTEPYPGVSLAPGEAKVLTFSLKSPLSAYSFFSANPPDSAYPVQFTVMANGASPVTLLTQLIYFQETQGVPNPLQLSLVIPLDTPNVFNPQNQETSRALEAAIRPGGRINRILTALQSPAIAGVPVTLAPTGEFLDSLLIMASPQGFTRRNGRKLQPVPPTDPVAQYAVATIAAIKALAAEPSIRIMNTPYADAPLPGLAANGLTADVQSQVGDAKSTVRAVLGVSPMAGWLLPTDGVVDASTFGQLLRLGVSNMILSPSSFPAGPPPRLTPPAQVEAASRDGTAGALVEDSVLTSRLEGGPTLSGAQTLQQFLAESATIMLEQPNAARATVVVAPSNWDPDPSVLDGLLSAISPSGRVPWLQGATPDAVLAGSTDLVARTVSDIAVDPAVSTPGKEYFDALRTARQRLDDFVELAPPASLVDTYTRQLLISEGQEWWDHGSAPQKGAAFARWVTNQVNGQFGRIQVQDQTITLTSRKAAIPLVIESGVNYKVQVIIRLESDKLRVLHGQACSNSPPDTATCLSQTLQPRAQTLLISAAANFSGRFPVQVDVQTLNNVTIAQGRLLIRSTAYNVVALGIMGAAALFLLISWIGAMLRRRVRAAAAVSGGELSEPPALPTSSQ